MKLIILTSVLLALLFLTASAQAPRLEDPCRLTLEDGSVIDVQGIGHSAPAYGDLDGDGAPDLLVGEFKNGACRIFRNNGSAAEPVFRGFEFLKGGNSQAIVPPS